MSPRYAAILCLGVLIDSASAQPLTLPPSQRPQWLRQDGIVMAGSWEPLGFRVRRDGAASYAPTPEQVTAYQREHSPEMVERLKDLGVNFVMLHCYKGGGIEAERESMADAVRFARLCHEAGLRVGVYTFSGTLMWDLFYKEVPQAKNWLLLDPQGHPLTYGKATYRYFWDRNHPDAQDYLKKVVRFAVSDIQTDLVHFDNYIWGPGWDANSVARWRRYLSETFTPDERSAMGAADLSRVEPPSAAAPPLLQNAWKEFSCASMAESYYTMTRYARSLRPDILMEVNPGGVNPQLVLPVDHGRLLQGGEAFWDEGRPSGYAKGKLQTRIRTYKVARRMENAAFTYVTTPLEMAESMAFNLDCLGALCWFEYGHLVNRPGSKEPVASDTAPFVRFYHQRHDLLRAAGVVADVAVLRSFPAMAFGNRKDAAIVSQVEEMLIESRRPFQIIYDHQLGELGRYRVLVLANCAALSDPQVQQIRRYVQGGGRLCVIGPLATQDQWTRPRSQPVLDDLPAEQVFRVDRGGDWPAAIARACEGKASLSVEAAAGLCAELTEQPLRRLVHLVNYRPEQPATAVAIGLEVPAGRRVASVALASPEHAEDRPLAFQQQADHVAFTVPQVRVYEIAVVTYQPAAAEKELPARGPQRIIFSSNRSGVWRIWSISPDGSAMRQLTQAGADEQDVDPVFRHDGQSILFSSTRGGKTGIWRMGADGTKAERICDGDQAEWSPQGREIVFRRGGQIFVRTLESGHERSITPAQGWPHCSGPAWSPDGKMIALACRWDAGNALFLVSAAGAEPSRVYDRQGACEPHWSPDGRRLVYETETHICTINPDGKKNRIITYFGGVQRYARFSPDGQSIVFCQGESERGPWELYIIASQGGTPRKLTDGGSDMNPDWK